MYVRSTQSWSPCQWNDQRDLLAAVPFVFCRRSLVLSVVGAVSTVTKDQHHTVLRTCFGCDARRMVLNMTREYSFCKEKSQSATRASLLDIALRGAVRIETYRGIALL